MTIGLQDLAARVGRTPQTLRLHIRQGWLRAEKIAGAIGWRVKMADARRWAAKYFGINLTEGAPAAVVPEAKPKAKPQPKNDPPPLVLDASLADVHRWAAKYFGFNLEGAE